MLQGPYFRVQKYLKRQVYVERRRSGSYRTDVQSGLGVYFPRENHHSRGTPIPTTRYLVRIAKTDPYLRYSHEQSTDTDFEAQSLICY